MINDPIVLVCAADDNYSMPLATMVNSAVAHLEASERLAVFVIDGGISDRNKAKILASINAEQCQITWLSHSFDQLEDLEVAGHYSAAIYLRLLAPKLLPQQIDKFIYLDCDLVMNRSLKQLWDIDMADKTILAVQEFRMSRVRDGLLNYKSLGIDPDLKYFNSGVLVVNAARWRQANITARVIDCLERHQTSLRYYDQDALNIVFAGQWGELDPRWNQTPFIYSYDRWQDSPFDAETYHNVLNDPYIVHFAESRKPWNHYSNPNKQIFYRYLDTTAWAGWRYSLAKAVVDKVGRHINRYFLGTETIKRYSQAWFKYETL